MDTIFVTPKEATILNYILSLGLQEIELSALMDKKGNCEPISKEFAYKTVQKITEKIKVPVEVE